MHKSNGWLYQGERCKVISKRGDCWLIQVKAGRFWVPQKELQSIENVKYSPK